MLITNKVGQEFLRIHDEIKSYAHDINFLAERISMLKIMRSHNKYTPLEQRKKQDEILEELQDELNSLILMVELEVDNLKISLKELSIC